MIKPIPDGFQSVTPSFTFKDSARALEFYKKAFGAQVLTVLPSPGGKGTMHATMRIGNSTVMMGDEMPGCASAETMGGSPASFYLYVENVDAFFEKAVNAGAVSIMPVTDMFWGDRMGSLRDPFGYCWSVATQTRVLDPEQIQKGAEVFFASMMKK